MRKEIGTYGVYKDIEVYIANDGAGFPDEESCLKYEQDLFSINQFEIDFCIKEVYYTEIFKYMFEISCDDVSAIFIKIPLIKTEIFKDMFFKIFGSNLHEYKILDNFEGEIILLDFISRFKDNRPNIYYFEKCTKKEVLEFLDNVKEEFLGL